MHKMKVYPFDEVARELDSYKLADPTITFHQQFNCAKCGTKQTMAEPNKLFTRGQCEECNGMTDIVQAGCNYLLHIRRPAEKAPEG